MAQNKKLFFSCLLLVLIFGQEIQSIQGRHLKIENKNGVPKLRTSNKILEKEKRKMNNAKQNNNLHSDGFPTVRVALAANANLMSPPAAPSVAVGESLPPPPPRHVDDFRPTAPGHSPGVGHSLQN
ncbi:hypothetical protein ACOSP7_023098 [Xanthoceras sorbifolium]